MQDQLSQTPNNPQSFFETLQNELERAVDRLRYNPTVRDKVLHLGLSGQTIPAIDVSETADGFEILAEVPGVSKDELDVSIDGEVVTLRGEKTDNREEKDKNYHLVERSYGHFKRSIPLGFVPDDDAVTAEFENGVLKLSIKKPASAKTAARQIAITSP